MRLQHPDVALGVRISVHAAPVTSGAAVLALLAVASLPACKDSDACPKGMAHVAAGTFTTGVGGEKATVGAFCMDVTEVTVDAYTACVKAGQCGTERFSEYSVEPPCNYGVSGRENHPMNCVDWGQAVTYCRAHAKRLPTQQEWEWAARGQSRGTTYPWGNDEPGPQLCWKEKGTCAVGSHPGSDAPGGIHDLAGNVWEWTTTSDKHGGRLYSGGSWGNVDAVAVRASRWSSGAETLGYNVLGFRCVR